MKHFDSLFFFSFLFVIENQTRLIKEIFCIAYNEIILLLDKELQQIYFIVYYETSNFEKEILCF